jgi:ATP-dependent Clp protease protease subunit
MSKILVLALLLFFYFESASAKEIILTEKNTVTFVGPVDGMSVGVAMQELSAISETGHPSQPIYLVINTPGGSVMAGLQLIEYMNSLRRPVIVVVNSLAASMGFHILQHSPRRLVTQFATIMSHRASGTFQGDIPQQINNRLKHVIDLTTKMDAHVVRRTKGKQTKKSYGELVRDEYYSVGDDAIKDGFADEVVKIKCHKSLNKYVEKKVQILPFLLATVKISKCPLITRPLIEDGENYLKIYQHFNTIRGLEF